jgi:hypothetical protein
VFQHHPAPLRYLPHHANGSDSHATDRHRNQVLHISQLLYWDKGGGPTICLSLDSLLLQFLLYTFLHFDNIFRRVTCQVSLDQMLIEFPE